MRVGSLFAGVGGFDLGFQRAGMTTAWAVEIDKQARAVFRHRFPNAEVYEDVRTVTGQGILSGGQTSNPGRTSAHASSVRGEQRGRSSTDPLPEPDGGTSGTERRTVEPVQLLCGGFPCQDYSVAGKRGGLVGDRGALWWEFHRLASELRPAWVVGENVPGLLSSNGGRDFLAIIASLVQLGYGVTWAVLDSQYQGVAQRRARLFIVGHYGGKPRPEILALSEGMFGHPAPSRKAGERTAGSLAPGAHPAGFNGRDVEAGNVVVSPLDTRPYADNVSKETKLILQGTIPRRLTPIECERLQGFPDGWTDVGGMKDSPRYRMMGNAVTVDVLEWIGRRIMGAQAEEV